MEVEKKRVFVSTHWVGHRAKLKYKQGPWAKVMSKKGGGQSSKTHWGSCSRLQTRSVACRREINRPLIPSRRRWVWLIWKECGSARNSLCLLQATYPNYRLFKMDYRRAVRPVLKLALPYCCSLPTPCRKSHSHLLHVHASRKMGTWL